MDVSTIWDFCGEVVGSIRPRKGYVPATVTRIDNDGTVWVTTGDGTEAPASTCTAGVAVGDVVSVSWSGAQMGVVGNASDPAASMGTVRAVRKAAESAAKVASGAQAIADAIGQHFFTDDNGVHVSTEKDNPTGERNILMNSLGILLRQGPAWLASFSDSAVAFYDGLGNAASNIVAQFGVDGAVIGRSGESHMELDYHSMRMIDRDGDTYLHVSDLRDEDGYATLTERFTVNTEYDNRTFTLMYVPEDDGISVTVNGNSVEFGRGSSYRPKDIIVYVRLYIDDSVVITYKTASDEIKASTFGSRDPLSTIGPISYAEGKNVTADNVCTHAEGCDTAAKGQYDHAEGYGSIAYGYASHAQNYNTRATGIHQTAIGRYNVGDVGNLYAFIVGNGTADDARSNAFAVRWDGVLEHYGDVPWTALTLSSGVTEYDSDYTPRYRRWGQMVAIAGAVKPNAEVASGGTLNIGTLPDGCRPPQELDIICQGSGGNVWLLKVKANGTLEASRYRSGATSAVMPITAWLTFNATFIV